jgi:hypothetical protein
MNKKIPIKGIIRDTSGQQTAEGACEEIINMRQRENVFVPVGKKKIETADTDYVQVFTHSWLGRDNEIGVLDN